MVMLLKLHLQKLNKKFAFPLIQMKNQDGTNSNVNKPCVMTVCHIELQDIVQYHQPDFIIIRGYYYPKSTCEVDFSIQEFIQEMFDLRLKYKTEKNGPMQEIVKLIMNSLYGKTIQKEVPFKHIYKKKGEEADKYLVKNHNSIIDITELDDSDIVEIKMQQSTEKQFSLSMFGIMILAMSKRIMNEVMCLAYENRIPIVYQDTDSMHIPKQCIQKLSELYKEKYDRKLIGKKMGQFHGDFASKILKGNIWAIESIFCGKKVYIDKLIDEHCNIDYHIRMKGVSEEAIRDCANKNCNGDLMELYRRLYNGESFNFNLAVNVPQFKQSKSMSISSNNNFNRNVDFKKSKKGNPENYFKY